MPAARRPPSKKLEGLGEDNAAQNVQPRRQIIRAGASRGFPFTGTRVALCFKRDDVKRFEASSTESAQSGAGRATGLGASVVAATAERHRRSLPAHFACVLARQRDMGNPVRAFIR